MKIPAHCPRVMVVPELAARRFRPHLRHRMAGGRSAPDAPVDGRACGHAVHGAASRHGAHRALCQYEIEVRVDAPDGGFSAPQRRSGIPWWRATIDGAPVENSARERQSSARFALPSGEARGSLHLQSVFPQCLAEIAGRIGLR